MKKITPDTTNTSQMPLRTYPQPNIEIRIVCVPERLPLARKMLKILNNPIVRISCDVRYTGSWNGTRLAWLSGLKNPEATHVITLEDDAIPCKDFIESVYTIAALKPDEVIAFYSLRSETHCVTWAEKNNSHWYVTDGNASGVGVMMPREKLVDFLRVVDAFIEPGVPYEDARLWGWQQLRKYRTWTTVPNLLEHGQPGHSTLGFNNAKRTSAKFIGKEISGMSVNWTRGLTTTKIFKGRVSETFLENFKGIIKK